MRLPGVDLIDPFGNEAANLLAPYQAGLGSLIRQVTELFYETIAEQEECAIILNRLRPQESQHLKQKQAEHFESLVSSKLTQTSLKLAAERAGNIHALVGVQILWLLEAYNLYQECIHKYLRDHIAAGEAREHISHIVSQRFMLDLEGQVLSYQRINTEFTSAFVKLDQLVTSTSNLRDLIRGALNIIGKLSGNLSAFFARVDERGELQIEQSYSDAADQYHHAMETGEVTKISIDPNIQAGQGPGGRAWRSGEIVISDAWLIESDKAPWRHIGERLGFRSSAAVPLLDESGRTIALLSLYSAWPGYFSTGRARDFFSHVQRVLSVAIQRCMVAPVIPLREQQAYRRLLNEQRVVIYYQPIINLDGGILAKVEALARLCTQDNQIVSPQRFIPALGRDELFELFKQGLRQACTDYHLFTSNQIEAKIAINFPVEGFDDRRYGKAIFEILEQGGMAPDRLQLEVLETQDSGGFTEARKTFIQHLRKAGIQIAEDDLGSGHSSLLRLEQYSFDEVKIDQGLVRGVLHNPKRAVEFILYLTRLAHAFDIPVTVEGLENEGMIEAAAILGADRGQGYSIARPMPAQDIVEWYRTYRYRIEPSKPRTAIGAMAGYLLWDMQLAVISDHPALLTEFVGAVALVEEFIQQNDLKGLPIDELLRQHQELVVSKQGKKQEAASVRSEIINELTSYWLAEIA